MRLLMLGLDNAGKSTLLNAFNGEPIDQLPPTLGFNIKTLQYKQYNINVWDVGGQHTIRSYWRNYFEQTDGLVFVIDSADTRRMDVVKATLHDLLKAERLAGASLLIFANKQDLAGALSEKQIAERLDLQSLGETGRHWRIVPCSAWTGKGLIDGVDWIVGDIAQRIYMMD